MNDLSYIQSLLPFFDHDFIKNKLNHAVSLHSTVKTYMHDFFSIYDFNDLLNQHVFEKIDLQLYANGKQVLPEEITTLRGQIDRHKVNNYVTSRGYSIKINQAQRFNQNLAQLHASLTLATKRRVSMNLYYSPSQTPCFNTHQDPYPLFIIQISGNKLWKYAPATREANLTHEDFTHIQENVTYKEINEGDVLHLPANVIHDAAAEKGASLHLTIGFMELSYADLWSYIGQENQIKLILGRPMEYDGVKVNSEELKRTMQAVWRRYFEAPGMEALIERWALDEARKSIAHYEPFHLTQQNITTTEIKATAWSLVNEKVWLITGKSKGCTIDSLSGTINLPWSKEVVENMRSSFHFSSLGDTGVSEEEGIKSFQQLYRMGLLKKLHG